MRQFFVGEKWVNQHPKYVRFLGEVIETSAQGRWGTVVITDDQGNVLDTYIGTAEADRASGEWRLDRRVSTVGLLTRPPTGPSPVIQSVYAADRPGPCQGSLAPVPQRS